MKSCWLTRWYERIFHGNILKGINNKHDVRSGYNFKSSRDKSVLTLAHKERGRVSPLKVSVNVFWIRIAGADLGGGCRGCAPPPPPEMTSGFLIQLVLCKKKLCGLLVLKRSKRRVHPLLKKILDPPLHTHQRVSFWFSFSYKLK